MLAVQGLGKLQGASTAMKNFIHGKSIISASAYLNGDVMKNEENGRISYYTSKKEVVYTSLLICENAPQIYLQEFQSMEHFKQELIEYLDYYNNRRIKAKRKGLPPAIHRQQALSAA